MPSQLICKGCRQPIQGRYITALGASWHPEHFVCAACHQPITEASFSTHNDLPYHAQCYLTTVSPRCAYCNQPITGQYYEHEGHRYHTECYRDHIVPRCAYCHKPITSQYYEHEGQRYHAECYTNHIVPRCAYCHKPITGQYYESEGQPYHAECYREHIVPRCAYCHKPVMSQYYEHEGQRYHTECYRDHIATRCAYCGKPLMGGYLTDYWGTHFCEEHKSEYPHCAYCGRLVPPNSQERVRRDNVVRCPICRSSAIETTGQAQPIFGRLVQWTTSQGLQYNQHQLKLELVDRATLTTLLQDRGTKDTLGVTSHTTHTLNDQVVRIEVNGISVLRGLPLNLFQGVTVHELGHAWLAVQGVQGLPSWAEEGFCELLAYRFYKGMNTPESRYHVESMERNKDPIYGEGFRRVRAIADKMGFQRFVEVLRTTKHMVDV